MKSNPWLQLIRLPNQFTVPGDILAGAFLAGQVNASVIPLIIISLCCYSWGLIANDVADLGRDTAERPQRPLPSGKISLEAAHKVSWFLITVALGFAAMLGWMPLAVTICILGCVYVYNFAETPSKVGRFITMGACRGLNILLGASMAGGFSFAVAGAGIETIYILGVTALALKEAEIPGLPAKIGFLIRGMIFLQAAFVVWGSVLHPGLNPWPSVLLLMGLYYGATKIGKVFYSS